MRKIWIVVMMSVMLTAAGLVSPANERAGAQEGATRLALMLDGTLERSLPANPLIQQVTHESCGVTLGGYCPGRYRSCIRAGRPQAECQARYDRCESCQHRMLECRQKVGHVAGYTCPKCLAALSKCRAGLALPAK